MTNQTFKHHAIGGCSWLLFLLASVWLGLFAGWKLSAMAGYAYPFWYDVMDIGTHIATYAPQHPYKSGFEQLPPEQHWQAFAQIADAVARGGDGLASITYTGPAGLPVQLLDGDERGHLGDVAHLFSVLEWLTLSLVPVWLLAGAVSQWLGKPTMKVRLWALVSLVSCVVLPLVLAGPKTVFYWLHVWVFPPEHPWFFYWDESLMSTLMKAPDLFAGIAAMITVMAIPVGLLAYFGGGRILGSLLQRGSRAGN